MKTFQDSIAEKVGFMSGITCHFEEFEARPRVFPPRDMGETALEAQCRRSDELTREDRWLDDLVNGVRRTSSGLG